MTKRNPRLNHLKEGSLLQEILKRKQLFLEKHPNVSLISLKLDDTTQPIPLAVAEALSVAGLKLSTAQGYHGYGPAEGLESLRMKIAEKLYNRRFHPDEIFISDGTNGDFARLQLLFGSHLSVAIQDLAYPLFFDGSNLMGVERITLLPSLRENGFFPDFNHVQRTDIIYFCSPNNPTGVAATREQLKQLVSFAKANHSILLFDATYQAFIQDPALPQSIYEIPGADEVAIEINSFSKSAGFTGVRLGWSVVPHALRYESNESINADYRRLVQTIFKGASIISQQGGLAILSEKGWAACKETALFYMENAKILKHALEEIGPVYGGVNAPYLWLHSAKKRSWELFQDLLEKTHILTSPGIGFGPAGENFVRLSAFCSRDQAHKAAENLKVYAKLHHPDLVGV